METKKKILFVIDSLGSGGAEKSLIALLTLLDYTKYDVDLLLFSNKGLYIPLIPKEVTLLNEPIIFKQRKKIGSFKSIISRIETIIALRNPILLKKYHSAQINWRVLNKYLAIDKTKYECAIAYSQGIPTYYVSEKVTAKKKIAWINTDYKKAPYNSEFDLKYYKKFNNIVAVSKRGKQSIVEKIPEIADKVSIVYDIISPSLIKKMALEPQKVTMQSKGIKILTIGRLVHLKGYDIAIDAAMHLKKSQIDFTWYILGEGPLKEELKAKITELSLEKQIVFLGTAVNPYPYINNSDIYVQPSRYEGFGMALAEAKILHKPIVATNFDIVYDQINDGENGIIAEMNGESISQGIMKLLNNPELYQKISRNLANETLGTEDQLQKIYNLIERKEK